MKLLKRLLLIILLGFFAYVFKYAWDAFPIISGYGAKNLCSCVFVGGRDPESILHHELGSFPLSIGSFSVHREDSSTSGSVFGLAYRKAIYRKKLGCTLINELSEEAVRNQKIFIPDPPPVNQDSIPWPQGNLLPDSVIPDIHYQQLNTVITNAMSPKGAPLRQLRAVIVLYDGALIAEKYAEGFNVHSKHIGWSMTKSVINACVGILVKEGKLSVQAPAPLSLWKKEDRNDITLDHLLHASSGLLWEENYSSPSGATDMLFKKKDMGLYAASFPAEHKPNKKFRYSSGTTNIVSRIIRETAGDEYYYRLPYEKLFYKLGMYNTILEPDAGGTWVGSSYSFGTARDWARFGLLYYNKGVWNGEQILPQDWVAYTVTPAPAAPLGQYGAQFWLNAGAPGNPKKRMLPDVPTDCFWASGFEGQNVWIIPSKKLVVVRLSLEKGNDLDENKFLADIIKAVGY